MAVSGILGIEPELVFWQHFPSACPSHPKTPRGAISSLFQVFLDCAGHTRGDTTILSIRREEAKNPLFKQIHLKPL